MSDAFTDRMVDMAASAFTEISPPLTDVRFVNDAGVRVPVGLLSDDEIERCLRTCHPRSLSGLRSDIFADMVIFSGALVAEKRRRHST